MRLDTRPFKHRDFRNMWFGQAISTIGGEIGAVAVPYQVYTLTHSTALVGLLGLASLIPLLFVPLIGGAIADANDRRSVLLRTETGMAVVAGDSSSTRSWRTRASGRSSCCSRSPLRSSALAVPR